MEKEIDRFIEYLKYQRNYSNFTCNNYNKDLNEYNSFILSNKINYKNMDYNEAKEYVIYLNKKNDAKSTISRKLSSLRTFYKYLVLNNSVVPSGADDVKIGGSVLINPSFSKKSYVDLII